MRALPLFVLMLALAACGQEATRASIPGQSHTYWIIDGPPTPGTNPVSIQYVDAAAIQGRGVKRATTIAFISLPPNPTRHGARMEIVNEYDCGRRRVRPVSTSLATPDAPPVVSREDREWVAVDARPNVVPLYDFVCSDDDSRAADARFSRVTDTKPLVEQADAYFAAHPAGRAIASD